MKIHFMNSIRLINLKIQWYVYIHFGVINHVIWKNTCLKYNIDYYNINVYTLLHSGNIP